MARSLRLLRETQPRREPGRTPLGDELPKGRLVELSGDGRAARTTTAVSLLIRRQAEGEPVVWVQPVGGPLYPPDLSSSGVDVDDLIVVQVPRRARAHGLARATELLLRSGAFGLVVVDLTEGRPRGGAWQGRLAGLARQHDATVVLLTGSGADEASAGPMVALRIEPVRERRAPGRFAVEHHVLRDKLGGPRRLARDEHRAPPGLP